MSEADVAAAAAHTDPPQAPAAEPVAAPEVTPGAVATPRIAPADGAAPPATPTDDAAKDKKEKKSKKERSDKTGKEKKEKKHRDKKEKSHRSHRSHRSKAAGGDPTSNESPAYYSTKLKLEPNPTVLRQLATVAAAKDATWVGNFIDIHGLKLLGDLLQTYQARPNKTAAELEDISASVAALKSVLSHENALLEVSRSRHTVRRLLLCMAPAGIDLEVQGTVIELLFTIFVKTPTGYQVTLDAFTNYAKEQRQPRFRILLDYLKKATEPSHQLIGFSLLDRLCSTPEDIDLRSSIYAEYQRAGLTEVIEHLKAVPSDDLQEAISEFEKDVREDTEELEKRFESLGIDFKDGAVLANTLNSQLGPTPVYTCWLSILRDLLAFPGETDTGIKAWMLIQRLVMQLSLQKSTLAINETSIKVEDLFASVADAPDVAKLSKQLADVQQDKQKLEKALASKEIEYKDKDITLTQLKSQLAESQEAAKAWEERARADAAELRTAHETMAQLEEKLKNAAGAAPAPAAAPAVDPAALAELQAKHTAELAAQADKTKAAEAKVTELEAKLAAAPAVAAPAAAAPAAAAPTERAAPAEGAAAAPATPVAAAAADPAVAEKLAKSESDLKAAEEKIKELQAKLDAAAAAGGAAPAADAAPVVTGGPPPPPAPKAPKAPPAPKLMMKGKLPPPGPAAPPAEGGDAAAPAAPAEGGEGGAAAPSGGPPPPPPPGGPKGPPPPPGPKGPPPPPGPKGPPPPPGPGGPPPPPGPGGPPPPPGLKGPPKGPPGKGPGLGLKGPAAAAEPAGPPKKRPQPPTKKMKGLAWNKVPAPKLGNSIWAKTGELEVPLDYTLVEDMFSFETKEAGPKEGDKGANKKKEPVTLIDGKRAQNINIFLGSKLSKVSFADLKKAILALDETVLTQEIVKLLVTYMPTDEELTQIEDWKKDNDSKPEDEKYPLGKAETFMLEMKSVPNCAERLQSLLFKLNFPVKLTETKPDIVSLKAASSVLKTSKNLTKMLEVMLWVGNFLNASNNAKANFDGFKVDFLTKLSDTKSNPKYAKELPTVLHFLVHLVDEKYPDLKDLPTELEVTKAAAKCSLPTSEAEVAALRKGLTALEGALNKVKPLPLGGVPATPRAGAPPAASPRGPPSTGDATAEHTEPVAPPSAPTGETDPSDKFQAVMRDFAAQARKDFDELEGLLKEAVAAYQETLVYFAEDPKLAPEEFFKVWSTFVTQWERARDEIRKAAEAKKKLEERAAKATHDPKKPAATGKAAAKAAAAAALASGTTRGRKKIDISAEAIEAATNAPAAKDDESSSSSSSSESEGEGPEKTPRAPKEKKEHKEGEHSPSAPAPAAGGDEGKPAAPAAEAPKPAASKFKAKPKGANADDIMAALGAVLKKPGAKK